MAFSQPFPRLNPGEFKKGESDLMSELEKPEASFYEWVKANDLLEMVKPLWESGGWRLRDDGKLYFPNPTMAIQTPWRHIKQEWRFDCSTWHHLMFDYLSKFMPPGQKFVPSGCHNCFKVVVRPRSLKELFALEKLQLKLNRPSKCGIEVRPTVHALYGGYFYNQGLEQGLERYSEVRQAVDNDETLGPEVGIILKRGCTEFELECGPSDQWHISNEQMRLERLVNRWVATDDQDRAQPDWMLWRLYRQWIEFAYANGDSTYAEFTNGKPLYPPVVTYHHLATKPSALETELPEKVED